MKPFDRAVSGRVIRKDALRLGRYHLPDGRVFEVAQGDIPWYRARVNAMIDRGLSLPVVLEHQPDAMPLSRGDRLANQVRHTVGWVCGALPGGDEELELELEIPDENDAKTLKANRYVSCRIDHDLIDPLGRRWDGKSISHVAITARPVLIGQRAFALSGTAVCLSLEAPMEKNRTSELEELYAKVNPRLKVENLYTDDPPLKFEDPAAAFIEFLTRLNSCLLSRQGEEEDTEEENEPVEVPASPMMMSMTPSERAQAKADHARQLKMGAHLARLAGVTPRKRA